MALLLSTGTVTIPLKGLVNIADELKRLNGELDEIDANIKRLNTHLSDEQFLSKAPEMVVEGERQRLETDEQRRARVSEILERLGG